MLRSPYDIKGYQAVGCRYVGRCLLVVTQTGKSTGTNVYPFAITPTISLKRAFLLSTLSHPPLKKHQAARGKREEAGKREADDRNNTATITTMALRRPPTRIELKADDVEEYDKVRLSSLGELVCLN